MKFLLTGLLLSFTIVTRALDPNHFTIDRITAPYFIVDGNSPATVTSAYVGFEVKNNTNSATTYSGLRFTITSIATTVSGQNYSLLSPASGIINVGTLAPGESKVCYYYVSYPASVTPQGTFNIQLSDNTPTNKTQSFIIRNRSSISANAGGTATQTFSNQDIIGGLIQDDVTYVVGNVKNNDESDFQVAVSSQFDPSKVSLLSTEVISSTIPGIPGGTTDSLYFITGAGSNGATVTIRWKFRITGTDFTTYLLPCAGATSGSTNYKYALNTALGSGTPITVSSSANPLIVTKSADRTYYGINSTATFSIIIENPGIYGITLDRITDEIPIGFTYQGLSPSSQVTSSQLTSAPSVGATGTITFDGGVASGGNTSFYVPANGSLLLRYTLQAPGYNTFNLSSTARAFVATSLVGSSMSVVSVTSTLPVSILSFDGFRNGEFIQLSWKTSEEINTDKFEIERSFNGSGYIKIGEVGAHGNSSIIQQYVFVDSSAPIGKSYYRLKSVDVDQRYSYSRVVAIERNMNSIVIGSAHPNPFATGVSINIYSPKRQDITFTLIDLAGRKLLTLQRQCEKGENRFVEDLSMLQKGTYVLQVKSESEAQTIMLVKKIN